METQQIKNNENNYLLLSIDRDIRIYKKVIPNFNTTQTYYARLFTDKHLQKCRWDDYILSEAELSHWIVMVAAETNDYYRTKTVSGLGDLIKLLSSSKDKRKKHKFIVDFLVGEL
jgi:hypothetical protein